MAAPWQSGNVSWYYGLVGCAQLEWLVLAIGGIWSRFDGNGLFGLPRRGQHVRVCMYEYGKKRRDINNHLCAKAGGNICVFQVLDELVVWLLMVGEMM